MVVVAIVFYLRVAPCTESREASPHLPGSGSTVHPPPAAAPFLLLLPHRVRRWRL